MNETYHLRGFTFPQVKRFVARLAGAARKIDPTRLLVDCSGGDGSGSGAGTTVMLPNSTKTAQVLDAHAYCPLPLQDASLTNYRTMDEGGLPLLIGEYGAPEAPPDFAEVLKGYTRAERKLGLEDYRLHKDFLDSLTENFRRAKLSEVFGSVSGMIAEVDKVRADEIRLITAAQRTNPRLVSTCFCQLADASGELFGATDAWRRPKKILSGLAAAVKTPLPTAEITPRVSYEGDPIGLRVTLINEDRLGKSYDCRVEIVNGQGRRVGKAIFSGRIKAVRALQLIVNKRIRPGLKPGRYALRMTLAAGGRTVCRNEMALTVLARPALMAGRVGASDPTGTIAAALKKLGATCERFSNNFRNKNVPILFDLRGGVGSRGLIRETYGQLKKIVQLGGCAVLFEPEPMLLHEHLFPTMIRIGRYMRAMGYVKRHPIFDGLPSDCVAGYEYADIFPSSFDRGEDVQAAGGEVISGGLSMHMWTRPADYSFCAGVYTVPIGRGQVVVCNMKVLDHVETSRTAGRLLANLVNYAASVIKPGGEAKLLSRCIDPLT
jgi:hypothetical protein